jgi:hypothetical protein
VDHPTALEALNIDAADFDPSVRSWSYTLAAGADLSSADTLRTLVADNAGDLRIGDQLIYTQNGRVRFAVAGNVDIGKLPSGNRFMINRNIGYNLATFAGDIRGSVRQNLSIRGGAIQSAIGDIEIVVGGNLSLPLSSGSAIRTTGMGPLDSFPEYSGFGGGGSISLSVGGDLDGGQALPFWTDPGAGPTRHLRYWDNIYVDIEGRASWSADFGDQPNKSPSTPAAGVATMAGGDVFLVAGGSLFGQFGTFQQGDITLIAHGDAAGFFQIAEGNGFMDVMGNVDSPSEVFDTSLALYHSSMQVAAQGNIEFGTVFNPTLPETFKEYTDFGTNAPRGNLTYGSGVDSPVAAARFSTAIGDVTFSGFFKTDAESPRDYRVLPPRFEIEAARDIRLNSVADFALAPAATGNLRLIAAAGSISGLSRLGGDVSRPELIVSDLDPLEVYFSPMIDTPTDLFSFAVDAPAAPNVSKAAMADSAEKSSGLVLKNLSTPEQPPNFFASLELESSHAYIHSADPNPIEIIAGGNIEELVVFSPKAANMLAGGDIRGVHYFGQHLNADDLTSIRAKGDIFVPSTAQPVSSTSDPSIDTTGFIFNGPGNFLVQAGGSIDLGISRGIQATGNTFLSQLPLANLNQEKGTLAVIAGLFKDLAVDEIQEFFAALQESGNTFSDLRARGELAQAAEVAEQTQREVIAPFFSGGIRGKGDLFMTSSQISTSGKTARVQLPFDENRPEQVDLYEESSDIYVITGGDANVGLTAIPDPTVTIQETDSGIFTAEGGSIAVFTGGDLNVNESRVMTFRGGNVLAYSGSGNINAGRGSKTAINAGSPRVENILDDDGNVVGKRLLFEPPSVGSGIRTLTYDPDGILGPQKAPLAGDGFLFAPQGVIDAGEAGIATRNLTVGASEVLNAQNIEVTGGPVGVPSGTAGSDLGALPGDTGALSEATKAAEQAASLAAANEQMAAQAAARMADALKLKWLKVEFIGFDEPPNTQDGEGIRPPGSTPPQNEN